MPLTSYFIKLNYGSFLFTLLFKISAHCSGQVSQEPEIENFHSDIHSEENFSETGEGAPIPLSDEELSKLLFGDLSEMPTEEITISETKVWLHSISASMGLGYSDNPMFGPYTRKSSGFVELGTESFVLRQGNPDYLSYLYFSHLDKNPVYAAVCDFIENNLTHKLIRFIPYLFENHYLLNKRVSPTKFPTSYFKRFKHSGVFRIRQSNFDVSIIENNLTFLSLIKGTAVLQSLRLGSTFFGSRGQFTAENIEVNKNQLILTKSIKHGYFQPFPEDKITGDGVYSKMPREQRKLSEPQVLNYKITITLIDKKTELALEVLGTNNVLVSLEMNFRKECKLSGVISDQNRTDSYFLKDGWGTYSNDGSVITFGPGKIEHQWGTMRGMDEKPNGKTVYVNGHTPFNHVLEIY